MPKPRATSRTVGLAAGICAALSGCSEDRTTSGVAPSKPLSELTSEELVGVCELLESRDHQETYCIEFARRRTSPFFDEERCAALYEDCLAKPREPERACRSIGEWKTCQEDGSEGCVLQLPDGSAALLLELTQRPCEPEPTVRDVERCIAEHRKWAAEVYACTSELADIAPPACWTARLDCR